MKKNTFIFLFLATLSCINYSCNNKRKKSPNILLIIADDLGYADLGCTGLSEDVSTPNIDRLAKSGVRFTQAYATSPICSPSRISIMTGNYNQRFGTYYYGGDGLDDFTGRTLTEILRDNDYITGCVEKIHYGTTDKDITKKSFPLNHGFDYYFGHTSPRKHYFNHVQKLEDEFMELTGMSDKPWIGLNQQSLWENDKHVDTIAFTTELFSKKACDFIKNNIEKKFFLQLSFNAVHNYTHQLPEKYLRENNLDGYSDWNPASQDYRSWYEASRYPNNPEGREHYLGQLYYLDKGIGRVIDYLTKNNLTNNTLIIFVSDNGGSTPVYANNYPLKGSKDILSEGGIRVPMIISFPGKILTSKVNDNIVSIMDILPTICNFAAISPPANIDGHSLMPLLSGQNKSIYHDYLVWDTKNEMAVRLGKWKYHSVKENEHAKYEMVQLEKGDFLYNLEEDIGEKTNLIDSFPQISDSLKLIYKTWKWDIENNSGIKK